MKIFDEKYMLTKDKDFNIFDIDESTLKNNTTFLFEDYVVDDSGSRSLFDDLIFHQVAPSVVLYMCVT